MQYSRVSSTLRSARSQSFFKPSTFFFSKSGGAISSAAGSDVQDFLSVATIRRESILLQSVTAALNVLFSSLLSLYHCEIVSTFPSSLLTTICCLNGARQPQLGQTLGMCLTVSTQSSTALQMHYFVLSGAAGAVAPDLQLR